MKVKRKEKITIKGNTKGPARVFQSIKAQRI